jgi:phosphoglycerate kinase
MGAPMPTLPLSQLDLEGRRVLVRVDLDVPLTPARGVADAGRLGQSLPTIRQVVGRGARAVLAAHLGDPRGRPHPELSLEPVGACLAELLGQEVLLTDEPVGDGARKVVQDLRPGGVALLENLRFSRGEEANDERFARALAGYADVYVNDALSVCHLNHASVAGVPRHVSTRGMGLALEQDVAALGRLMGVIERPFVVVVGGARVSERMTALESLLGRADAFCFGGAVANTFLKARGASLGRSLLDADRLAWARSFITRAQGLDVTLSLPRDLVAAAGVRSPGGRVVAAQRLPEDLVALDIGPDTAAAFAETISRARTVFWTGPMGAFEAEPFATGTLAVARALASSRADLTVAAGRETAVAVERAGVAGNITHVSSAGPAALDFLSGRKLPGLVALET